MNTSAVPHFFHFRIRRSLQRIARKSASVITITAMIASSFAPIAVVPASAIAATTVTKIDENFNTYDGTDANAPSGWTFTNIGSYGTGGNSPNSLQFGASDSVASVAYTLSGSETSDQVSFWLKGNSTSGTSSEFDVYESTNGSTWTPVSGGSFVGGAIPTSGTIETLDLSADTTQVKFTYTKDSGNVALDDVKITAVSNNSAPIASDRVLGATENASTDGTLKATDADNDPLTFAMTTSPAHGTITAFDASTGAYTYTPDSGYVGLDSFEYIANDGTSDSNSAKVGIDVLASSASVTAEDFGTWDNLPSFKGINVGFETADFSSVSGITVDLYSGATLVAENTASAALLDDINTASHGFTQNGQLSTPFVISGSLNDTYCGGSACWTPGTYSWNASTVPTKAVITVTGKNASGDDTTATDEQDTFTQGEGTFASFFPMTEQTVVVKPGATQGWAESSVGGGSISFSTDAHAPLSTGALELTTGSDNNDVTHYTKSVDIPLSDLSEISYQTKQLAAAHPATGNATLRISLNLEGTSDSVDEQLMYEPYYNGFTGGSDWQTWDITPSSGMFWSNYGNTYNGKGGVSAGSYASNFTIADVLHDHPDAKVVGLVLSMGSYNPSQQILADDLEVTDAGANAKTVYDFEPAAPAACNSSTFDGLSDGGVNGQDGWSATGPYDQAVVDNIYGFVSFGCKTLRISDEKTSGSFGDWVFSAPAADVAGENATDNHFEAQFDIASAMLDEQPGMELSVAPTDANGSRMSYLRFEDQADGIHVFFDDATDATKSTTATFNQTEIAGGAASIPALDRSTTHTVQFVMDFNAGADNDVVTVTIDGALVHTGGSWEDYYRNDPEQAGNGNTLPSIDRLIFQARGTANPSDAGNGFLFDNVSISTSHVYPAAETPTDTHFVYQGGTLACGATVNTTHNNSIQFVWDDPVSVPHHRTLISYPDGTTRMAYTNSRNVWLSKTAYGDNGFGNAAGEKGNGIYTYEVQAENAAGQWSDMAAPCTLALDTHSPTAQFDPAPPTYVNGNFDVSGTATDNVALKGVLFDVRDPSITHGNSWVAGCITGTASTTYLAASTTALAECTINTKNLTEGKTYTLRIHAGDNANYGGGEQQDLILDTTRPNGSITAPANSSTKTGTFTITGMATDTLSGVDHVVIYVAHSPWSAGGYAVNAQSATWDTGTGTFSYDVAGLPDGDYVIKADIFDKAGNTHFASPAPTIHVVNTVPTLAITAPAQDGDYATSTYDFTAEYDNGVTSSLEWAIRAGSSCSSGTVAGNVDGHHDTSTLTGTTFSTTLDTSGWTDGTYCFVVNDGHGLRPTRTFTVDNTAPDAPTLTSPDDGATVNGMSITQAWSDSSTDIDHYAYRSYDDQAMSSLRWQEGISGTSKTATNVGDATYWWRVAAVDAAGNMSPWSDLWKLVVDNTIGVTGTTPAATTTVSLTLRHGDLVAAAASGNPAAWYYFNDVTGAIDNALEGFISGPAFPVPAGDGSAHFGQTTGTSEVLGTMGFVGSSLSELTGLSYETYGQSGDAAHTPMLVMDIATTSTGAGAHRLVYTPSGAALGGWQTWNPLSGTGWWFTDPTLAGDTGCIASSTCSWSTIIGDYPSLTIDGIAGFKVDNTGGAGYVGDVDKLELDIAGVNPTENTIDFEPDSSTVTTIANASDLASNASTAGDPVTVEWDVKDSTGAAVTVGTVDVNVNGGAGCSAAVTAGACDIPSSLTSTTGSITIVATYEPASGYDQSSSPSLTHPINSASTPTTIITNVGGGGIFGLLSLIGDLNGDGKVDFLDFAILMAAIGGNSGSADLNHDGAVNMDDLNMLMAHWTS